MNDVYKHASARNVSVSVVRRADQVVTIVEDDGSGYDVEAVTASSERPRIGIAGMRERASMVGGELTVESSQGHGTTVRARVPLSA